MKFLIAPVMFLALLANAEVKETKTLKVSKTVTTVDAKKVETKAASSAAPSSTLEFGSGEGSIKFKATGHPSALKINGEGPNPKGNLSVADGKMTGDLIIDMTKLDTGISLRTKHMKEKCLEVEKYPEAKLTVTDMKMISGADSLPFAGTLLLHGVSKPVSGNMKLTRKDDDYTVHADFGLKLSDYAIVVPTFAGVSIDDQVAVEVDTQAKMKKL